MHILRAVIIGNVFTGSGNKLEEAIIIKGDRITYVGELKRALRRAQGFKILDYTDHLVTPGLIDSHCHMSLAGLYLNMGVSLNDVNSIDDIKNKIKEEIKKGKNIIFAFGLDESRLKEGRLPKRWDLDEISNKIPIIIEHISGHLVIVNSELLRRAGIERGAKSPPGGMIELDENGEPSGILRDSAMNIAYKFLPSPTEDLWIKGINEVQRSWLSMGYTAVEDVGTFGAWESISKAYDLLRSKGSLLIRARIAYAIENINEIETAIDKVSSFVEDDLLRSRLIKVFYDGSGFARTALLYEDWCENFKPIKGWKGLRVMEREAFARIAENVLSKGLDLTVHAIGDKAVDEILESYNSLLSIAKGKLSLVHAIVISNKGLELLRENNVYIKTQPGFIYTHGHIYGPNLCKERMKRAFPLRTLLDNGVIVASSTDAPFVGMPDPREAFLGAIFRKSKIHNLNFGSDESITFKEALITYTLYAAKATGFYDIAGSIEEDKKADIVIWNIRDLNPSKGEIESLRPLLTMVNGNIVYSDQKLDEKI